MHQVLNLQSAETREQENQSEQHRRIADACDDERLASCGSVDRIAEPESNEEITAQANSFPSEIEQKQVVPEQEREHRGDEQVHIRKEPAVAFVMHHELGRIEMNPKSDERDDQDHDQRQRIHIQSDVRLKTADVDPGPKNLGISMTRRRRGHIVDRNQHRDGGRDADRARAQRGHRSAGQVRSDHRQQQCARERQGHD
jgi:hypothetical protein